MDLVYSATLSVSLLFGSAALLAALLRRMQAEAKRSWSRALKWASGAAWLAFSISFASHLGWGHTPGGPAALSPWEFVQEHLSFAIAAGLPGVALLVGGRE